VALRNIEDKDKGKDKDKREEMKDWMERREERLE
jgi:hypothetical protein